MKQFIKSILPAPMLDAIQHSRQFNKRVAERYARTSKRIDICSAQLAHYLHLSKHAPLEGKVCLEVGSGWVLSHAVVCYLLGAARVIATDIFPFAQPQALRTAVRNSISYLPRDILSAFASHSLMRNRFDRLLSIRRFSFDALKELGIEYIAPFDFGKAALDVPVDFVYSISAFEHVPCGDIAMVMKNIVVNLNPGGTMIHCIHLEDHQDSLNHPFGFLSVAADDFSPSVQSQRGNRIRRSRWRELFGSLENTTSRYIYEWTREDRPIPARIDPSIVYKDEADLRVSHIGVYTEKMRS